MNCANCGRETAGGTASCPHCERQCGSCGKRADFLDMKCVKCGAWLPERITNQPARQQDSGPKIAAVVIGLSAAVCLYFLVLFDTGGGAGVHNVGLLQDRQFGVAISAGTAAVSALYLMRRQR